LRGSRTGIAEGPLPAASPQTDFATDEAGVEIMGTNVEVSSNTVEDAVAATEEALDEALGQHTLV